jgi:hypothetical protein
VPVQPISLVKAARIAEAHQRAEEASQQLREAQTATNKAAAELAAATNDAQQAAAKTRVRDAEKQLAEAEARAEYEQVQLNGLLGCDRQQLPMALVQYATFGLLAIAVLGFLIYGIISDRLLSSLSTIATSRGLITFLITVVTVTIALVLILSSIVSDSADRARRFQQGKDILVALIGVLGTIVGFYFGQSDDKVKGIAIAPVYVSTLPSDTGHTITLVTSASGGTAPYTYHIDFTPDVIADIEEQQSTTGLISAQVSAPAVTTDTEVSFAIRVTDRDGREAGYKSDKTGQGLVLKKK